MKILLSICLAAFSLSVSAQVNLDSLWRNWTDESLKDSARADSYADYIWNGYLFSDPDSAIMLLRPLEDFARTNSLKHIVSQCYNQHGIAVYLKGESAEAIRWFEKSLEIYKDLQDTVSMGIAIGNIGSVYWDMGVKVKAVEYMMQSLKIQEALGDSLNQAVVYVNLGVMHRNAKDYDKAFFYFEKSLSIDLALNHVEGEAIDYINLGGMYAIMGDYERSDEYYHKSRDLFERLGRVADIPEVLFSLGDNQQEQGNYPEALEYYTEVLNLAKNPNNKKHLSEALVRLGDVHLELGDFNRSIELTRKAYDLAVSEENLKMQFGCAGVLYKASKGLNLGTEALKYHELKIALGDSLQSEEAASELQRIEFEYQLFQDSIANAEQARIIEEAHQEEVRQKNRTRNIFGGVGFFALLLAGGFYWRWRYVRNSKAVLQVEKDRSENLLLNILPEEIADELKEKGRADARDFEDVSILFTDFKGFTAASEKLSAQDLVSEINTCFEAFDGIMGKYNIEKIKTIGDAYMAAGGLPVPTDDSVKNTVLAALEMQDFIRDRKTKLDAEGKPGFEMRVGVHTGPVVAGIVGVKKFQYDIWGDTVNTASRMESSGEVGKVNISEATYELLKGDTQFSFESRGKIQVKGKGEIEMYFVENHQSFA